MLCYQKPNRNHSFFWFSIYFFDIGESVLKFHNVTVIFVLASITVTMYCYTVDVTCQVFKLQSITKPTYSSIWHFVFLIVRGSTIYIALSLNTTRSKRILRAISCENLTCRLMTMRPAQPICPCFFPICVTKCNRNHLPYLNCFRGL